MSGIVGLRVVRGPNWQWQSQDGGDGGLGTVVSVTGNSPSAKAVVRWDSGTNASYRMGEGSAFDLRIFDNAACGVRHVSVVCDACNERGIMGIRWKCRICNDYDLCTSCYMTDKHDITHAFLRITEPSSSAVILPPRESSSKIEAKGICPGAIVTRSSDWKWGDQDGGQGKSGVVTEIASWPGNSYRNAVRVYWNSTGSSDLYRFGFEGKLDVVATTCQQAGKYYPQHLPNLGQPEKTSTTLSNAEPSQRSCKVGDRVRISVPVSALITLQADHGGWIPEMSNVVGQFGTVRGFTEKGNVQVEFDSNKKYIFNPVVLTKFTKASVGDIVRIISDTATAKARQAGHGGWNDKMTQALGKVGKVVEHTPSGDLKINIGGSIFIWNPECCVEPTNADKEAYTAAGSASRQTASAGSNGARAEPSATPQATTQQPKVEMFKVGDAVTIINDEAKVRLLQGGHGGWNNDMAKALGKTGQVVKVESGSVQVKMASGTWWFNPACCVKADSISDDDEEDPLAKLAAHLLTGLFAAAHLQAGMLRAAVALRQAEPRFKVGNCVRIDRDLNKVKALQRGHGGWHDIMTLVLGKVGKVTAIDSDGDVQVNTGIITCFFNPDCLTPISDAEAGDCLIS